MARLTTPGGGLLMLLVLQVKDVVPSFFLSSLVKLKAGCQQPVVAVHRTCRCCRCRITPH